MAIGPHTRGWTTTLATPAGSDAASDLDTFIQNLTRDVGERTDEEHDWNVGTSDDGPGRVLIVGGFYSFDYNLGGVGPSGELDVLEIFHAIRW